MKFSLDSAPGSLTISAYTEDAITVAGQTHAMPLVITAGALHAALLPASLPLLRPAHLFDIAALGADILIVGTGPRQVLVDRELITALAARGVGVEFMNSPAACRCFNVLVSENRAVAAALFGP